MNPVNQYSQMKSGDKFYYYNDVIYTLQKLPDFNLWILISESNNNHWMGPVDTSFGAFGGHHNDFAKI